MVNFFTPHYGLNIYWQAAHQQVCCLIKQAIHLIQLKLIYQPINEVYVYKH